MLLFPLLFPSLVSTDICSLPQKVASRVSRHWMVSGEWCPKCERAWTLQHPSWYCVCSFLISVYSLIQSLCLLLSDVMMRRKKRNKKQNTHTELKLKHGHSNLTIYLRNNRTNTKNYEKTQNKYSSKTTHKNMTIAKQNRTKNVT